ncbi:MAG: RodZ domain-containing protein [Candidatus Omnitrophota bacterium]|jgi:transcriptional regulator with XRE-family HTH domain
MESIGSRIKAARESKGISIDEAQKETRISGRILSAIEADRAQELISGPVYIKSFIKKYADYLGLDGASLAESFTGEKPAFKEQISVLNKDDRWGRAPAGIKFPFKKIIYAAIAVLVIFFAVKLIGIAGSKTIAFFKSRPKAENKVVAAVKPKPAAKPAPKAAAAPALRIPKGENLMLSLKARADVYLKLRADGSVVYDGILKKGSSERWEAKESFEVSASKGEALAADMNGTPLAPLGKGVIKGLKLPK